MANRDGSATVLASSESAERAGTAPQLSVVVHPLVLLSTVDHYTRVAKDTRKRVVGVLLGTAGRGTVDVTNSFAVPFEEDLRDPRIWYLDHSYLETMSRMYKKVNASEVVVGFYSTGPKIKENDIKIDELVRQYCAQPVFVIIDVRAENEGIPTTAYVSVDEVDSQNDRKEIQRAFKHVASAIGAYEAEEVGVEHLLRDVNDPTVSTLAAQIKHKLAALATLRERLADTKLYLENVLAGKLPVNNHIVYNLQTIFNLLPNLNVDALVKSMLAKTNDMHLAMYCAALVRCILALHDLVNNKISNKYIDEGFEKIEVAKDAEAAALAAAPAAAEEAKDAMTD
ncbi:maintenance of mitochondrial structure and function-domain-containing protein [Pelagophyceae sp. CCMP2097]|nr:maintenance of mitochondrial structure and function-domain-containing protein [Pelagophyceae sp. CCMP2097]|mmetsp:Transcript_5805/g.18459  ORF Transcript_5805/g.18459 Transcript_5805/m.18459 type:complete len:340 (-) Transcript_5805:102-1121(-)|eukprot:CAMPEP_0184110948 /NCGR_PEP_ID=MMETSP0974-20121125/17662_1 /TAXON_ID=483370 /ORGANISM="non described non described, Strain CCMP2097" /LENGTH=339 /DNA_ID=CAMNT_0026414025 /DNA_START=31 /DNA_END=1050 /DNA_ORIENTATION=+